MTITVRVSGVNYFNFDDINISKTLDDVSGAFSVSATATNINANDTGEYPFRIGNAVEIVVDGVVQLTGFIEVVKVDYSNGSHTVTFAGRDKTCDIVDSFVGEWAAYTGGTLLDLIIQTLDNAGIDVMLSVSPPELALDLQAQPFTEGESAAAGIGDSVFRYLESYTRKRQVLMTSNGAGNLLLIRTNTTNLKRYGVYNIIGDTRQGNNIKRGNVKFDSTKRFHFYRVSSAQNASQVNTPRALDSNGEAVANSGSITDTDLAVCFREVVDDSVRTSRTWHIQAEKSSNNLDCFNRAVWERNLAKGRYLEYNATVSGHSDSAGGAWELNAIYPIVDDFCGVRGSYLLKSVEWIYSISNGSETNLTFCDIEAYSNAATTPPKGNTKSGSFWSIIK